MSSEKKTACVCGNSAFARTMIMPLEEPKKLSHCADCGDLTNAPPANAYGDVYCYHNGCLQQYLDWQSSRKEAFEDRKEEKRFALAEIAPENQKKVCWCPFRKDPRNCCGLCVPDSDWSSDDGGVGDVCCDGPEEEYHPSESATPPLPLPPPAAVVVVVPLAPHSTSKV